jgi:citrate synthase
MDHTAELKDFQNKLALMAEENNKIPPYLHLKYNTKRGLRDANGAGVLVGLTEIGDVHGFIIDEGEKIPDHGRLLYRGISIEEIVDGFQAEGRFGFEEICYLLMFGDLPNQQDWAYFCDYLKEVRNLPDAFIEDMILKAPSNNIMNKLARSVLALYSYDDNPDDISVGNVLKQCIQLIARMPIMAAYGYQAKSHYYDHKSLYLHMPNPKFSTAENFLSMIRKDRKFTKIEAELLDLALVLHAEHGGGNNSTFTTHVVTSSDTDTYSAIAAAIGSLKGPKHGGANIKVTEMMEDMKEKVKDWKDNGEVGAYLTKLLNREAYDGAGLIYGLGHAVYTLSDPRAILLKEKARCLAEQTDRLDEFNLYEKVAELGPSVFAEVKKVNNTLAPNVDFYSGFVYSSLNIPTDLYTPLFAMARIAGWSAHRIEELVSGGKIIRPAYRSVVKHRNYVPFEERQ